MKKFIRVFILLLFSVNLLVAKESIYLTNGEWPPYLSEKLPHYGFASHIVSEAFKAVGVEVEYGFFPWKRSYEYAKNGVDEVEQTWHGTIVWVYTDERAKYFNYSDIAIKDSEVLFHLRDKPLKWKSIQDLKGVIIGGTLHTTYPTFEKAEKDGILKISRAGGYDILFKRLLQKRIDAVPQVRAVGSFFLDNSLSKDEREKIAYSPTVIQNREYHLILSKNIKENEKFLKLFNRGLKIIKDNGTYKKLLEALENGNYNSYIK